MFRMVDAAVEPRLPRKTPPGLFQCIEMRPARTRMQRSPCHPKHRHRFRRKADDGRAALFGDVELSRHDCFGSGEGINGADRAASQDLAGRAPSILSPSQRWSAQGAPRQGDNPASPTQNASASKRVLHHR